MDKIKSKDLERWLDYVNMSESEFDRIADHFRDPRVWRWTDKEGWIKKELKYKQILISKYCEQENQ